MSARPEVTKAEAEAGVETAFKGWSPLRIKQAIIALGGGLIFVDSDSVSLAHDTTVTLATFTATDTQSIFAHVKPTDDADFHFYSGDCAVAPQTDHLVYCVQKTNNADEYRLMARQKDGASQAINIYWSIHIL